MEAARKKLAEDLRELEKVHAHERLKLKDMHNSHIARLDQRRNEARHAKRTAHVAALTRQIEKDTRDRDDALARFDTKAADVKAKLESKVAKMEHDLGADRDAERGVLEATTFVYPYAEWIHPKPIWSDAPLTDLPPKRGTVRPFSRGTICYALTAPARITVFQVSDTCGHVPIAGYTFEAGKGRFSIPFGAYDHLEIAAEPLTDDKDGRISLDLFLAGKLQ